MVDCWFCQGRRTSLLPLDLGKVLGNLGDCGKGVDVEDTGSMMSVVFEELFIDTLSQKLVHLRLQKADFW